MGGTAQCAWPVEALLGEGPLWLHERRELWFVDIKGRRIHCFTDASQRSWSTPEDIGFLAPGDDGALVCGLKSGLHRFWPDRARFEMLAPIESELTGNRLNDACVDPQGRLWFGTMDDAEREATGSIYCFDRGAVRNLHSGYVIPNGPAISPDGRTLYLIDSTQRVIRRADIRDDGSLAPLRVFAEIESSAGHPDGAVVDAQGCLWVALFGGWGVRRYSPQGALLESVALPVANCTKPAFGGVDLRELYVTTATKGLSQAERRNQPLAGGLFRLRTDVSGVPSPSVRLALQA